MNDIKLKIYENKIRILENENEILREQVKFLENLFSPICLFPPEWNLSPFEKKILQVLIGGQGRFLKENYELLFYDKVIHEQDLPQPKIIDVMICRLRANLLKYDIPVMIKTEYSLGYTITKEEVEYLKQFMVNPDKSEYENLKTLQKKVS